MGIRAMEYVLRRNKPVHAGSRKFSNRKNLRSHRRNQYLILRFFIKDAARHRKSLNQKSQKATIRGGSPVLEKNRIHAENQKQGCGRIQAFGTRNRSMGAASGSRSRPGSNGKRAL
jgi:hypothetical protein